MIDVIKKEHALQALFKAWQEYAYNVRMVDEKTRHRDFDAVETYIFSLNMKLAQIHLLESLLDMDEKERAWAMREALGDENYKHIKGVSW